MADTLINPGYQHTAPQGSYRPRTPVNVAFKKREHRPTRAHRLAFSRVVSVPASVTPQEWDDEVVRYQGHPYSQRGDRCGQNCVCADCVSFDCSGLQCHVARVKGIGIGCLTSFVMSSLCFDNGLFLPLPEARSVQSHWAVIGADLGRAPLPGDEGHVVDGRGIVNGRAETMEAMGTRWGCLIANWDGRGWNAAYRIPGVDYNPLTIVTKEIQLMFIQTGDGTPVGRKRTIGLSDDGTHLELWNGARIVGDQITPGDPSNLRRMYPKGKDGSLFCPAGDRYKGLARHLSGDGLVATRASDGATVDVFCVAPFIV